MKRPAFQFYPGDWLHDAALRSCSVGARGLWIEMMCLMHQSEPYGFLLINQAPINGDQLARMVGASAREVTRWLGELEQAGVFNRDGNGSIYSRRMVRDEQIREARAKGGEGGSEHGVKGAEHGKKGGRPSNIRGDKKPPLEPPPSSSSSSSSSNLAAAAGAHAAAAEINSTPENIKTPLGSHGLNNGTTRARVAKPKPEPPTTATWLAYSEAYRQRYGVDPVRNAKVNGQLSQFVKRIGAEESPPVAAWFVRHNKMLYVSAKHPTNLLLRDAEGLRTEWASGRMVTDTAARQMDRKQNNLSVAEQLIAELRTPKGEKYDH